MRAGTAILAFGLLLMAGCTTEGGSSPERYTRIDAVAARAGWNKLLIPAGRFDLRAFTPANLKGPVLTIYIEGDGVAFVGRTLISADPTPSDPLVLGMALADPGPAAYLARPCQFIRAQRSGCSEADWTLGRYSSEVVASMDEAVSALARQAGARRVVIVGYSGGGAVAMLLAERRGDVAGVVTLAANLDLADWTRRNGLSPLQNSLDPADRASVAAGIPQVHFVGARDGVVQPEVAKSFLARIPAAPHAELISMANYTHTCCWERDWPELRRRAAGKVIDAWAP